MPILHTESPCIGKCELDAAKERCLGCGRLKSEIEAWKSSVPEWRHEVSMRLLVTQGKKVRKRILRDVADRFAKKR